MKKLCIEYSIISPGTERSGRSEGYMAITKPYKGARYLLPVSHKTDFSEPTKIALKCYDYSIENIAISRFELIFSLNTKRFNITKKTKVLLCGFGPVGFGAMLAITKKKIKNFSILTSKNNLYDIAKQLNTNFTIVNDIEFDKYDYIIDATGDGKFLQNLIKKAKPFTSIIVLGTPRKNYLINALEIHRKNLSVIGAHEITGFSAEFRNRMFHKLLKENVDVAQKLCYFIRHYMFDISLKEKLTEQNRDVFNINIFEKRFEYNE